MTEDDIKDCLRKLKLHGKIFTYPYDNDRLHKLMLELETKGLVKRSQEMIQWEAV